MPKNEVVSMRLQSSSGWLDKSFDQDARNRTIQRFDSRPDDSNVRWLATVSRWKLMYEWIEFYNFSRFTFDLNFEKVTQDRRQLIECLMGALGVTGRVP